MWFKSHMLQRDQQGCDWQGRELRGCWAPSYTLIPQLFRWEVWRQTGGQEGRVVSTLVWEEEAVLIHQCEKCSAQRCILTCFRLGAWGLSPLLGSSISKERFSDSASCSHILFFQRTCIISRSQLDFVQETVLPVALY